jgi:hypothetical protein
MLYVLAAIGLPTLACMVHAFFTEDREAVRGGFVLLGLTMGFCVLVLPVIGLD